MHFQLNGEKKGHGVDVSYDELMKDEVDATLLSDFTTFLQRPLLRGVALRSKVLIDDAKIPFSFVSTDTSSAWVRVGNNTGEILPVDLFLLAGLDLAADAKLIDGAQQMINVSLRGTGFEPAFDLRDETMRPMAAVVGDLLAATNRSFVLYHSCACTFAAAFFRQLGLV